MKVNHFFKPRTWLVVLVWALLSAEVLVRVTGLVDFPLYVANSQLGYIPAASQQGSFLNKNNWEFNSLHMGAVEFKSGTRLNLLLVGDSVVFGGNSYRQQDRLGPSLEVLLQGRAVWPISAGSWALRNELAYLRQYPQVLADVDQVIFVLNSGDFGEASSWSCEATHPRVRPTVALWYLFGKYVYPVEKCGQVASGLLMPPGDLAAELRTFLDGNAGKTSFVLYPDREEAITPALEAAHFAAGRALLAAAGAQKVMRIASDSRWSSRYYKAGIHPTPEGNRVLATILAGQID